MIGPILKSCEIARGVASPDCPGGQSWWASRWRVSANCALARTGGCLRGDVPPSEAGRFWNFDTEFTQFSDNFYAKFIPLEMFKYLWNIMFINVSYKSAMFFNLGIQHFLSFLFPFFPPFPLPLFFPFPLSSLLFSFPFLFLFFFPFSFYLSFSLSLSSSFPFLFSLPFPLFSFLSPFFPFTIFALLPDFWCRGGSLPPCPPPPPIGYAPGNRTQKIRATCKVLLWEEKQLFVIQKGFFFPYYVTYQRALLSILTKFYTGPICVNKGNAAWGLKFIFSVRRNS